mgnify:CR=1 FL=1
MYPVLFRNVIFPLMELSQGTKIQKYLKWLEKTQWWKPEELEELQNKKLRALIRHAYENVPYYHRLFKRLDLSPEDIKTREDLNKIPFLTKDIIRKNFNDMQAKNINRSQFLDASSSGTTGEPLKFYISKDSYSFGWAQSFRCWGWAGYELGEPYVKIDMRGREKILKKIQDRLMNSYHLGFTTINRENIKRYLLEIKSFNPKIIRSYASPAFLLAKYASEFEIKIQPGAVMSTGEKLFSHYRRLIEEQFNCKVFDCYGGEATPLAFECEMHDKYHLCDETAIVEILRGDKRVSPGEMGEIVFTNLDNYVMPFIRYKVGDVGIPSDEMCECGRGLSCVKSIEGRTGDIVVTPSGNFLSPNFFTNLFKDLEGVNKFQILQEKLHRLDIKVVKNEKFTDRDADYISKTIKSMMGDDVEVNIDFVDYIPSTKSGKNRFIISKINIWQYDYE